MSTARRLTWLDVFTSTPLHGNGLAVVHDADDIDDETMLAFARETKLSETTFVQADTTGDADYVNRIWTMGGELPFAGHPSLGTAIAVARAHGQETASYVQRTPSGTQPIDVTFRSDTVASASMLQGPVDFRAEQDPAAVLAAAGLTAADAHPELPPQTISCGQPHLMVPVADASVLDRAAPDFAALRAVLSTAGALVLYLAHIDGSHADARGYFIDPGVLTEDPATGSAAGPLCAYVNARLGTPTLEIDQGVAMGRPSRLSCAIEGDRVRVGGDAVILAEGTIRL